MCLEKYKIFINSISTAVLVQS